MKFSNENARNQFLLSLPHINLLRMVEKKSSPRIRTRLRLKPALRTSSCTEVSKVQLLESMLKTNFFSRPSTWMRTVLLSGMTTGRTVRLCVAMGVMTKLFELGAMMGPPALNE
jgi:hypothetical protein